MPRLRTAPLVLLFAAAFAPMLAAPSRAIVNPGEPAPGFTKNVLGGVPPTISLSDFSGKVVVLAIIGYAWTYCLADGPSVETDLHQYYEANFPGQVQFLGCDVLDGTAGQLQTFAGTTGYTFPLLLKCYNGPPAGNFVTWYGERDNYVVINKQGIVRYRAAQTHPYSDGYYLNEIRGCVDSLVSLPGAGAGDPVPARLALSASPNPCRGRTDVTLALPRAEGAVRVSVFDASGRRVQVLWDAPAEAGLRRLVWNARDAQGVPVRPGVYMLSAEVGGRRVSTRVAVLH